MSLSISLPSDTELKVSRRFAAAPDLLFMALTTPALLVRWYGGLVRCEIDLRLGGQWRFVSKRPDGREIGQFGVYREIEPDVRLVRTENWTDWNPGEVLVSAVLVPDDGGTRLETTMRFPSREVRDMLIKSGMNDEAEAQYARLDAVLADYQT